MSGRHVASKLALVLTMGTLTLGVNGGTARANPRGSGWSIQPSPNPAGTIYASLASVSCPGDGTCTAAGDYSPPSGGVVPLAEHYDGTTWSIQLPPVPAGASTSLLQSISCATRQRCMAVGFSISGSLVSPLVEESNATTWKTLPTPRPPDAFWAELKSVSCTNLDCIAVGGFIKSGVDDQEQPLSERWNGRTWSLIPTLNPHAENGSGLDAVTCPSAGHCEAVGSYVFADVIENVFAFGWDGTAWTFQPQVNPGQGRVNADYAVSCMGSTSCTSVGTWNDFEGRTRGLAESWDGTSWTRQPVGNPPGFQTLNLFGVSCSSPACEAVGDWSTSLNGLPASTLAERWDGTSWSIQPTPNPTGARSSSLNAVACSSSTACVAVGSSWDGSVTQTLVETYSG